MNPLTRVVPNSPLRSRVYSRSSAHHLTEHQQNNEDEKQAQRNQHKAQARIVMSFLDHGGGNVMYFFHALHVVFKCPARDVGSAVQSLPGSLPRAVWNCGFG